MSNKVKAVAIAVLLAAVLFAANAVAGFASPNPDPANITQADGTTAAVGGENEVWVFPTNSTPTDLWNIQWAVDNVASGGRVLLKQYARGTSVLTVFRFDASSHVNFTQDLTIEGEITSREDTGIGVQKGTTVYGGQQTFNVGSVSGPPIQPSVSIRNIRFDGAAPGPIVFRAGKGHNEVSGCSIVHYRYGLSLSGIPGAFPIIADPVPAGPNALMGTFNITDNYIGRPDDRLDLNNIMHVSNANLALTISGNIIEDAYWAAIAVFGNIGETTITNNTITKTQSRQLEGAAISVGLSNPLFFRNYAYDGSTVISNNKISVSSYNSSGIVLLLYPRSQYTVSVPDLTYVVSGNVITVGRDQTKDRDNLKAALACLGACSNTVWKENTVNGVGRNGIFVTKTIPGFAVPLQEGFPSNNSFTGNNLTGFTAIGSQLFVDQFAANNDFANNDYGGSSTIAGAVVQGDFNALLNENFHGDYPGKFGTPRIAAVLFDYTADPNGYASENNMVAALKNGQVVSGDEVCTQIIDRNWEMTGATTNAVPGISRCEKMPSVRLEEIAARVEQNICERSEGIWTSDATGNWYCSCPSGLVLNMKNRCGCPAGTLLDFETGVCGPIPAAATEPEAQ